MRGDEGAIQAAAEAMSFGEGEALTYKYQKLRDSRAAWLRLHQIPIWRVWRRRAAKREAMELSQRIYIQRQAEKVKTL